MILLNLTRPLKNGRLVGEVGDENTYVIGAPKKRHYADSTSVAPFFENHENLSRG